MEKDDGERRCTLREYHSNVAVWNDDRGRTMWTYEYDYENVDKKTAIQVRRAATVVTVVTTRARRRTDKRKSSAASRQCVFCTMCAHCDDELSNVWNQVLFAAISTVGRACRATSQTSNRGGWHCRAASLWAFFVQEALEQGQRGPSKAHKPNLVTFVVGRSTTRRGRFKCDLLSVSLRGGFSSVASCAPSERVPFFQGGPAWAGKPIL